MRNYIILLATSLVACLDTYAVSAPITQLAPTGFELEPTPPLRERSLTPLGEAVLEAMQSGSPLSDHARFGETKDVTLRRYKSIALSIVTVTDVPREAFILASLGFFEGRYWAHIDEGRCNAHPDLGNCDNGHAFSIWQIHPGRTGIVVDGDCESWTYAVSLKDKDNAIDGEEMVANRDQGACVALAMVRKSLKMTTALYGYAGEGNEDKARMRLEVADRWLKRFWKGDR